MVGRKRKIPTSGFNAVVESPKRRKKETITNFDLFMWGQNTFGELGLGTGDDENEGDDGNGEIYIPTVVKENQQISSVCVGAGYTFMICNDKLYSWGINDEKQLGRVTKNLKQEEAITKVEFEPENPIKKIVCGSSFGVSVSEGGSTFIWGTFVESFSGKHYFSSLHNEVQYPMIYPALERAIVTEVAAADAHVICLTSTGKVFEWGLLYDSLTHRADKRESPRLKQKAIQKASLVPRLGKVVHIAAGGNHFFAVNDEDKVFCWGLNSDGQLGLGHHDPIVMKPVQNKFLENIALIKCGTYFSIFVDDTGDIYSCGRNTDGQCGLGMEIVDEESEGYMITQPTKIDVIDRIVSVACGSSHTLALSNEGEVFSWGMNSSGQLGMGESMDDDEVAPVQVSPVLVVLDNIQLSRKSKIADVFAGGHSSALIVQRDGPVHQIPNTPTSIKKLTGARRKYQTPQRTSEKKKIKEKPELPTPTKLDFGKDPEIWICLCCEEKNEITLTHCKTCMVHRPKENELAQASLPQKIAVATTGGFAPLNIPITTDSKTNGSTGGFVFPSNNTTGFKPPDVGGFKPPSNGGGFVFPSNNTTGGFKPPDVGGFKAPDIGGFKLPEKKQKLLL